MKNRPKRGMQIDDFSTDAYLIKVQYNQPPMETDATIEVCRACFEQWLEDSGRLEWCNDTSDEAGEHLQSVGTLPVEEYWQHAEYETKTDDLRAYIMSNENVPMR